MNDISAARHAAAETAYQEFEFDEGCSPEATGGWEDDGLGNFTRTLFIVDQENPSGDTVKGQFNVSFEAGSVVPDQVWATQNGNDIGRIVTRTARAPGM
jgi:hypothetical protein|nr:hypothetical protein [Neorhizobium tomejilense]